MIICNVLSLIEIHIGILVLLGIGVLGGALGAWFFQKIRIPQVVGYIVFGIIIGKSGLKLLSGAEIESLRSFTWFALGIIGFLVGGELKFGTFRKYGKQFVQILLWEGISAFILVGAATFGFIYLITGNLHASLAAGIVLGAIASATDPASTVEVLWENRARGVLTTTIIAIVALDDALAMTLYGVGTSCAEMLLGEGGSLLGQLGKVFIELAGSIIFGLIGGGIMVLFLRYVHQQKERMLAITIGMLLCVIGLASAFDLDVILVTMAMGLLLVNFVPHRSDELFKLVRSFAVPIYVMFFVMVGARLGFANMPLWLWGVVVLYVIGRSAGKFFGCYMGARISGAAEVVQKYSGLGIFAQGGVAIGLSIMASQHLGHIIISEEMSLGEVVVSVVTATTMIVQIIGPPLVKLSVKMAKENDRNITEVDIIERLNTKEAAIQQLEPLSTTDSLAVVLERFVNSDFLAYPVVNMRGNLEGMLTLSQLRDILLERDCWDWMVVADVLIDGKDCVLESAPLKNSLQLMNDRGFEYLPVVDEQGGKPTGILDVQHVRKVVQQEMIRIKPEEDTIKKGRLQTEL